MPDIISIKEANYIEDYKISLLFNDGKKNIVDFKNFILKSQHPDIKKYQLNFRTKYLQEISLNHHIYHL